VSFGHERGWTPPRDLGPVNWRGLWTLYRRGTLRFVKFAPEGVGGTLVSSLLFLAVFTLAWGETRHEPWPGVALGTFIAPGIAAYALFHNAFENSAFPLLYDKLEGMVGDILGAPLTPLEMVVGYVLPAASCGLITGASVLGAMALFVELPLTAPLQALAFAVLGATLFALLGFLTSLWARKWDRYSAVETFLVLPLGLLSGTFFPLRDLPETGQHLILANPVFYAVDGFRAGFLGQGESDFALGLALLGGLCLLFGVIAWAQVRRGYRLKR